jgi:hypothetical protein
LAVGVVVAVVDGRAAVVAVGRFEARVAVAVIDRERQLPDSLVHASKSDWDRYVQQEELVPETSRVWAQTPTRTGTQKRSTKVAGTMTQRDHIAETSVVVPKSPVL